MFVKKRVDEYHLVWCTQRKRFIGRYPDRFQRDLSFDILSRGVNPASYTTAFIAYANRVVYRNILDLEKGGNAMNLSKQLKE